MSDAAPQSRDRFTLFLGVACVVLAILTLLLAWQNRGLKTRLAASLNTPPPGGLQIGDTVGPFGVLNAAGQETRVAFDGQADTLLFVFSSTCAACQETIPKWNRLLAKGVPKTINILGIQTDFKQTAGAAFPVPDLRFPVFGAAEPDGELMSKFPAIPVAALIDGHGAVKSVSFGVPTDAQLSELRRALTP
jgi:thiol-disulfide isomerase/thioredoxin